MKIKRLICIFLTTSFLFAQEEDGYYYPTQCAAGYNVSSRLEVCNPWGIHTDLSFIYWMPTQSNMELGIVSNQSSPAYFLNGTLTKLGFEYEPGFQVGLGMNLEKDHWDILLEYTWFRSTARSKVSLDPEGDEILFPSWQLPDLLVAYYDGDETWKLSLDILEFQLGRAYAVGVDLSFRPYVGIRAALIDQKISVNYENVTNLNFLPRNHVFVEQKSNSWGIGPRTGLETNWSLGKGFRFFGNGGLDLLYTVYPTLNTFQEGTTVAGVILPGSLVSVKEKNDQHIRAHLDLDFGFAYGTYFYCKRWHVDFCAGYQFQIFYDQNMFRTFVDDQTLGKADSPHGNLYIHGLTTTLRFDF